MAAVLIAVAVAIAVLAVSSISPYLSKSSNDESTAFKCSVSCCSSISLSLARATPIRGLCYQLEVAVAHIDCNSVAVSINMHAHQSKTLQIINAVLNSAS
jgi:hypothetical protein